MPPADMATARASGACGLAACGVASCGVVFTGVEMTVAEACIAAFLAAGGLGTVGTNIFVNTRPATPDNLISVFAYAGEPPERTYDTIGNSRPGIQVWVRDTSAGTGRTRAESVFNLLDGIANTTLSGTFFLAIQANQSPMPMGDDENGRKQFVLNFSTIVRR